MGRKRKGDKIDGWINLDKPEGLSSNHALVALRKILNAQKAGHAGTLDPLASGVLPIALGEATKTVTFMQDQIKSYDFTIIWGEQRDTDDAEGEVIATSTVRPSEKEILNTLPAFTGEISQKPPIYSAIKKDGQRAYKLAREDGIEAELEPRIVTIRSLDLVAHQVDSTQLSMTCGKGTYVRALARDLAQHLGTKGYIGALRRTRVGPFDEKDAISLDKAENMRINAGLEEHLHPVDFGLDDIPAFHLNQAETVMLRNGRRPALVSRPDFQRLMDAGFKKGEAQNAVAYFDNRPQGLVEISAPHIRPVRLFNL